MIKSRPGKSKTTSQLIKELDTVFSEFIRLRDCDHQGTVKCFVSSERVWWRDADAAHFVDRAHMATRWSPTNVHACSQHSNRYDPNHKALYRLAMYQYYGGEAVTELEMSGRSYTKHTSAELIEMIAIFNDQVKMLRNLKKL